LPLRRADRGEVEQGALLDHEPPVDDHEVSTMIDIEQIARKAKRLDPSRLQTLSEFVDFLLTRGDGETRKRESRIPRRHPSTRASR